MYAVSALESDAAAAAGSVLSAVRFWMPWNGGGPRASAADGVRRHLLCPHFTPRFVSAVRRHLLCPDFAPRFVSAC